MKNAANILPLALGVLSAVSGCNLAPTYSRPDAPVPAQWPAHAGIEPSTQPATDVLPDWREFFADGKLQQLIEKALDQNRDLRLAALNVERARQLYGVQRAEALPTVDASAAFNRQRVPGDLSRDGRAVTSNLFSANVALVAWELDLFGRIRSLSDAALQQFLASEQARRGVQIMLISGVADAYLRLAADLESLQLAQSTLQAQQDTYNLVKKRLEGGISPEIDLHRVQTQVETARREVARFTQQVALDRNALELLVGAPVPDDLLPAGLSQITPLKELQPGISSEILLSRPDIIQAENQLRAAYANIGAARAVLFPRITLTATGGTASNELAGLFDASSRAWTFAPQMVMPIFDARAWSALKVTKVDRQIALTQYEKAIQTGFREVADALAVRSTVGQELAAQESLVRAVAETYRLSLARYEKGVDSYLDVLDAQRSLFAAEEVLIAFRHAMWSSQVRLYAVLGGGWNEPSAPVATPATEP